MTSRTRSRDRDRLIWRVASSRCGLSQSGLLGWRRPRSLTFVPQKVLVDPSFLSSLAHHNPRHGRRLRSFAPQDPLALPHRLGQPGPTWSADPLLHRFQTPTARHTACSGYAYIEAYTCTGDPYLHGEAAKTQDDRLPASKTRGTVSSGHSPYQERQGGPRDGGRNVSNHNSWGNTWRMQYVSSRSSGMSRASSSGSKTGGRIGARRPRRSQPHR